MRTTSDRSDKNKRPTMSPANRHPKAAVFHAVLIIGLLLVHYWLAPPLLVTGALLMVAALWPWFTSWGVVAGGAPPADGAPQSFAELTKNQLGRASWRERVCQSV